ncbi:hypothetical protein SLA2020_286440 [Shorea laevis]
MDNRVAQHRTHRFGEVYHRRIRPRSVTHWRAKKAVVATSRSHQKLPVVNPVVSVAGDGSPASGEVVFPSGEGVLWSDNVSSSPKPQGGGPGLSTDAADVQIQGRTEGGAPAGTSSTLPVVNPVVSAEYDGSPASGTEGILSGEGCEPGLSTEEAVELIQGRAEGGAPAGISSTSTLALYSHSHQANDSVEVGGSVQWAGVEGLGVPDVLGAVKTSHRHWWTTMEGVPRLLRRGVVDGDYDRVLVGDIPSSEAILTLGTKEGSAEAQSVSLGDDDSYADDLELVPYNSEEVLDLEPLEVLLEDVLEERDPPEQASCEWVLERVKNFCTVVGLSYEGYEEQMMALFSAIERNRKVSTVTKHTEVLPKSKTKGKRELQRLECSINYDSKRGSDSQAKAKVRVARMVNEA